MMLCGINRFKDRNCYEIRNFLALESTSPQLSEKRINNILSNNGCKNVRSPTWKESYTVPDRNSNNVFDIKPDLVKANSYAWPEVTMSTQACDGHQCLVQPEKINNRILYVPKKHLLKPNFTPPPFKNTGILTCPNGAPKAYKPPKNKNMRHRSSVIEVDKEYNNPGNMEFIEYTYPTINALFRYSTFAVPNSKWEWEWIYGYINGIKNSFRRKYHCEVGLCSEPGTFKGRIAFLVRIESDSQGNILKCRSGLPNILKDIMVLPLNATNDVNCYISEYLIKRKYIFQKSSEPHKGKSKR